MARKAETFRTYNKLVESTNGCVLSDHEHDKSEH